MPTEQTTTNRVRDTKSYKRTCTHMRALAQGNVIDCSSTFNGQGLLAYGRPHEAVQIRRRIPCKVVSRFPHEGIF
eukprot:12909855-Prorocentrum_lima.AAC.1